MIAALVCREMKWTYDDYMDQPRLFVLTLISMLDEEAIAIKKKQQQ